MQRSNAHVLRQAEKKNIVIVFQKEYFAMDANAKIVKIVYQGQDMLLLFQIYKMKKIKNIIKKKYKLINPKESFAIAQKVIA